MTMPQPNNFSVGDIKGRSSLATIGSHKSTRVTYEKALVVSRLTLEVSTHPQEFNGLKCFACNKMHRQILDAHSFQYPRSFIEALKAEPNVFK